MNNSISITRRIQALIKDSLHIDNNIKKNLLVVMNELTEIQRSVLNSILLFSNSYSVIFPSAATIAQMSGCCRETVHESINVLEGYGLLKRFNRGRNTRLTNLYKVPQEFFDPEIRMKLRGMLYALSFFTIHSFTAWAYEEKPLYLKNPTQYKGIIYTASKQSDSNKQNSSNSESFLKTEPSSSAYAGIKSLSPPNVYKFEENASISMRSTAPKWLDSLTSDSERLERTRNAQDEPAPDFSALLNPNKKQPYQTSLCKKKYVQENKTNTVAHSKEEQFDFIRKLLNSKP